jgi:acyl carrier protein
MNQALEQDLKKLIVDALMLDDVTAEEIDSEAPLFMEGLALDSIDALELSVAIEKRYGVKINAEDEGTREIFRNVRSLASHIDQHRPAEPS